MFPFDDVIMIPWTNDNPLHWRICATSPGFSDKFCRFINYSDVIMGAMASQITSLTIVYSAVTGLCAGNSPVIGVFPAQIASNEVNITICIYVQLLSCMPQVIFTLWHVTHNIKYVTCLVSSIDLSLLILSRWSLAALFWAAISLEWQQRQVWTRLVCGHGGSCCIVLASSVQTRMFYTVQDYAIMYWKPLWETRNEVPSSPGYGS